VLVVAITGSTWPDGAPTPAISSVVVIGQQFFTTYALAFEAAAVLLLAAMVGAIILARED
jgi:NAD(P)H-quinone oxidoreductase subunit 6